MISQSAHRIIDPHEPRNKSQKHTLQFSSGVTGFQFGVGGVPKPLCWNRVRGNSFVTVTAVMFIHQPPHAFETIDFPIFLFNHLFKHPTKRQLLSVRFRCVFQPSVVKYHTQQCCKTFTWIFLWHNGNPWRTPNFCSRKTWWWSRSRRSLHPSRRWGRRKAR